MTVQFMRAEIGKVYNSQKWRNRVSAMPANQVIAVYNRMRENGTIEYAKERRARELEDAKYHQVTMFEYMEEMSNG